jgi:hypothetical protein
LLEQGFFISPQGTLFGCHLFGPHRVFPGLQFTFLGWIFYLQFEFPVGYHLPRTSDLWLFTGLIFLWPYSPWFCGVPNTGDWLSHLISSLVDAPHLLVLFILLHCHCVPQSPFFRFQGDADSDEIEHWHGHFGFGFPNSRFVSRDNNCAGYKEL